MSTTEEPPQSSGTPAQPSPPSAPDATQPMPPQAPPPGYAPPGAGWPPAWPQGWPQGWGGAAPAPVPVKQHSAWIRTMTPLTTGILCVLLVLAGFGLGVVVGWQHDGHGPQRVVFEPGQRRGVEPPRTFGNRPNFNGPGNNGPGSGPNGQPNRQRPNQQNPAPSPSSSS